MPFLADKLRGRVYNQSIRFRKSKIHKNYFFCKIGRTHGKRDVGHTNTNTHTCTHTQNLSLRNKQIQKCKYF